MANSTISMAIFNSYFIVYQRLPYRILMIGSLVTKIANFLPLRDGTGMKRESSPAEVFSFVK